MSKKIYALVTGITQYDQKLTLDNGAVIFPKLAGCVNDAMKIKKYLQDNYDSDRLEIKELFEDDAHKQNICAAFTDHLAQATEGDAVLFYFSGHGTQEYANPCFKQETDGKLESLVCFYDAEKITNCLLSDKELRYLIKTITDKGASMTAIIDSCHSGGVTRNAELLEINFGTTIEKKSKKSYTFSERPWQDFIFADIFSPGDFHNTTIENILPEGNHLTLSASESNQTAIEINGEGVFTKHLLEALSVNIGYLSNNELFERVLVTMKTIYLQQPRMYTPPAAKHLSEKCFLTFDDYQTSNTASVYYNASKGWILTRGELNGVSIDQPPIKAVDPSDPTKDITAIIDTVEIDYTLLKLPSWVNKTAILKTDINTFSNSPVKIYLSLEDAIPKDVLPLTTAITALNKNLITIVSKEDDAEYTVQHLEGVYYLSKANDRFRPVSTTHLCTQLEKIIEQISQISKWKFLDQLERKSASGAYADFIRVEFSQDNGEYAPVKFMNNRSLVKFENWQYSDDGFSISMRMRFTNLSQEDLYICLLYLDLNYCAETFLLEPTPYLLTKGSHVEIKINGEPEIPVVFHSQALLYNYEEYLEKFKIIVSRTAFQHYPLVMDPMEEPPLPGDDFAHANLMGLEKRGGIGRLKLLEDWFLLSLDLLHKNPAYNKIPAADLQAMLDDKKTTAFAEGLFFQPLSENSSSAFPLSTEQVLKPAIQIIATYEKQEQEKEKNLIIDLANWWSRRKRNDYFSQIRRRFPERTVIVSEGDSWFQHPLVYDIIDHLSKIYAVRCVAAAADTLSNYFSGQKKRGDYFLDVLQTIRPPFFLLSGGGNDILGSQFRTFIEIPSTGYTPQHEINPGDFVNEAFSIQIDHLMNIYDALFNMLAKQFPEMITIVHGYDYPIHLDQPNKGWLGRYMIEKGISSPVHRRELMKYILNVFNDRLKGVAEKFPGTVSYLDLRNSVNFISGKVDDWYDEIHPNAEGFQRVGLKFIERIESLKNKIHSTT